VPIGAYKGILKARRVIAPTTSAPHHTDRQAGLHTENPLRLAIEGVFLCAHGSCVSHTEMQKAPWRGQPTDTTQTRISTNNTKIHEIAFVTPSLTREYVTFARHRFVTCFVFGGLSGRSRAFSGWVCIERNIMKRETRQGGIGKSSQVGVTAISEVVRPEIRALRR
jgi:hypothetical protein